LCASSFSESGALFALGPRLGFGAARRGSARFLSEMEIQRDALGQASPRTRSGSFFAVDHPRNSELIGKHPKAGGPESLLERHPHRSFFCQGLKDAFCLCRVIEPGVAVRTLVLQISARVVFASPISNLT